MEGFRQAVNWRGFQDLGFCGPRFTWCNMQRGENRIYLRLDRAFATTEWINRFGNFRVHHLVESTSDHCVLMIADTAPPS